MLIEPRAAITLEGAAKCGIGSREEQERWPLRVRNAGRPRPERRRRLVEVWANPGKALNFVCVDRTVERSTDSTTVGSNKRSAECLTFGTNGVPTSGPCVVLHWGPDRPRIRQASNKL